MTLNSRKKLTAILNSDANFIGVYEYLSIAKKACLLIAANRSETPDYFFEVDSDFQDYPVAQTVSGKNRFGINGELVWQKHKDKLSQFEFIVLARNRDALGSLLEKAGKHFVDIGKHYTQVEAGWRRKAADGLSRVTRKIHQISIDGLTARLGKIDQQALIEQKNKVVRLCVASLMRGFGLSRCGVLLPIDETSDIWSYEYQRGHPEEVSKDALYRKDVTDGLTGITLGVERPDKRSLSDPDAHVLGIPIVQSLDIEADSRWSKKYGTDFRRNSRELGKSPLMFLGVPFFLNSAPNKNTASGAVVAIRPLIDEKIDEPVLFKRWEIEHLVAVTDVLASVLDRIAWQRIQQRHSNWHQMISHIWSDSTKIETKFSRTLRAISDLMSLDRALIALVERSSKCIYAIDAVGFDEGIVDETKREIYSDIPEAPEDEDILSVCCRENWSEPRLITRSDRYWKHVHKSTALRHNVIDALFIFPIRDPNGNTVAIVLGDLPVGYHSATTIGVELDEFKGLGLLINQELRLLNAQNSMEIQNKLVSTLGNCTNSSWSSNLAVSRLLEFCCIDGPFDQAAIFSFDSSNFSLLGVRGYHVNSQKLRKLKIDLNARAHDCELTGAIAHTYKSGDVSDGIHACKNSPMCAQLEIAPDSTCFVFKLTSAKGNSGIVLLSSRKLESVPEEFLDTFERACELTNLSLQISQIRKQFERARTESRAERMLIRSIETLTSQSELDQSNSLLEIACVLRSALCQLLKDIATILEAELCGMFLCDETFRVENFRLATNEGHLNLLREHRFKLQAGYNYKEEHFNEERFSYTAHSRSLTASVLRTLRARSIEDITKKKYWSRRLGSAIKEGVFPEPRSSRTWVGAPILFRSQDNSHLYGVITATRCLESPSSKGPFLAYESLLLQSLGTVIAIALRSIEVRSHSMSRLMKWFTHDVPGLITEIPEAIVPNLEHCIDELRISEANKEKLFANIGRLEKILKFVYSGFASYRSFAKEETYWRTDEVSVEDVVELVSSLVRSKAEKDIKELVVEGHKNLVVSGDYNKLLYICYALLDNAVKATIRNPSSNRRIRLDCSYEAGQLKIVVQDHGCGFDETIGSQMFKMGISNFGSSGLGLTVVRSLVGMCRSNANTGVSSQGIIETYSDGDMKGATIIVSLPVEQKEKHVDE